MERCNQSQTLDLTDSLDTTEELNKSGLKHGNIAIPAGSSITTLTFHGAPHRVPLVGQATAGTYTACYVAGTAVTLTVAAGRNYPMPDALFAIPFVKIVANAAGSVDVTFSS